MELPVYSVTTDRLAAATDMPEYKEDSLSKQDVFSMTASLCFPSPESPERLKMFL